MVWGPPAIMAGIAFGLLATAIQAVAHSLVRAGPGPFPKHWGTGVALRLGGVVLFAVAVSVAPATFPPLPTAFGYLGVLVPLLFMETRLSR
jgi:hypothetical protein